VIVLEKIIKSKIILTVFLSALIIFSINISYVYLFLSSHLKENKVVIIKRGLSVREISNVLEKEGAIKYKFLFRIIASLYSIDHPLRSGEYQFTPKVTPYQILHKIASGSSIIRKLYIPEGITVKEILDMVDENDRLLGTINMSVPEGHLMPSTYFYSYGDKKKNIIKQMLDNMSVSLDKAMLLLKEDSPIKTRKELLILASIIEKEAGNHLEKPIVASVFLNRLKIGMKLQADPTVIYAHTQGQSKFGRSLTREDLKIDSPYNTYRVNGLPPAAICVPSYSSIMAVVQPQKTNYLYFVANGSGTHNFSSNLQDHNQNVARLRAYNNRSNIEGAN
jgi:UPF0755 protein